MRTADTPNFFAAAIEILPSHAPRSMTKSLGVTCAIVSIRSTTSSGVGTQMTSLPAWPTCGSNFVCAEAGAETRNENESIVRRRTKRVIGDFLGRGQRNLAER